jgi:hypothetical protein
MISCVVVHFTRIFWSPEFCGSYAPLNLEISRNLLLKQLGSAPPLKLQNRISWNLVGSKDTICSCAYYQGIFISWILWALCPFQLRHFPKFTTEAAIQRNSYESTEQITLYWPAALTKTNRENKNVKYNIYIYIQVSVRDITLECLQITPPKI